MFNGTSRIEMDIDLLTRTAKNTRKSKIIMHAGNNIYECIEFFFKLKEKLLYYKI